MRTTLTLDDDVAKLLEDARRKTGASLRQLVNEALRSSLEGRKPATPQRYSTKAVSLGRPHLEHMDDVADALAAVEGEGFQPTGR
ncbi:MAG: CopG family transcriptional regulator [Dehalococcoidia bacterium]